MTGNSVSTETVAEFLGGCHGTNAEEWFRECGARWMRVDTRWDDQQPSPDADYDFSAYEAVVERARANGVRVLPILDYCAEWASSKPDASRPDAAVPTEAHVADWKAYVEAFVENFPDIEYFEIWNEPNIGHFMRNEPRHEKYVDRLLVPAAEAIHAAGREVVAPAFTTEWPAHPPDDPRRSHSWSVADVVEEIDRWLSYDDAWKHVDYLSVHYVKGDTEKPTLPHADNVMALYDWFKDNYVDAGKVKGLWNTEEGLTATEALDSGFVSMEPWEREPYPQWAPRYVVPVVHWALANGWEHEHQWKVFWFRMHTGSGTLSPSNLIEETDEGIARSQMGDALRTTMDVLTDGDEIAIHGPGADVGFGLFSAQDPTEVPDEGHTSYDFTSYAFDVDGDVLVAAWLDLPGIEFAEGNAERPTIQAIVRGVDDVDGVHTVDYSSGERGTVEDYGFHENGDLWVRIPLTADPVLYFRVE